MRVLIDVDNLEARTISAGLVSLADRILTVLPSQIIDEEVAAHFRLYGGWNYNNSATRRAQAYAAELRSSFPLISKRKKPITVTMELAQSADAFPGKHFANTLRKEGLASGIAFQQPSKVACRNAQCPIEPLFPFFRDNECPYPSCSTSPSAIASQSFQKMVDSMMVADLAFNAFAGDSNLCIVSSDDDLWPGILVALRGGAKVTHLQPRFNGVSSRRYLPSNAANYIGMGF